MKYSRFLSILLITLFSCHSSKSQLNWFLQESGTALVLYSVRFVDVNTGYAAGNIGTIVKTTNGGINWAPQQNLATSNILRSIRFVNANTGYAVGDYGTIIKTTTGGDPVGIKPVSKEIPKEFNLSQNYPNPFNPSTKIEFAIPSVGTGRDLSIRLVVYELLGCEVATLVNEQLKPGTYEVEWDGWNYPSGVYFYKLISESFTQTKRMVLIK
jgi:hypothetical protein